MLKREKRWEVELRAGQPGLRAGAWGRGLDRELCPLLTLGLLRLALGPSALASLSLPRTTSLLSVDTAGHRYPLNSSLHMLSSETA